MLEGLCVRIRACGGVCVLSWTHTHTHLSGLELHGCKSRWVGGCSWEKLVFFWYITLLVWSRWVRSKCLFDKGWMWETGGVKAWWCERCPVPFSLSQIHSHVRHFRPLDLIVSSCILTGFCRLVRKSQSRCIIARPTFLKEYEEIYCEDIWYFTTSIQTKFTPQYYLPSVLMLVPCRSEDFWTVSCRYIFSSVSHYISTVLGGYRYRYIAKGYRYAVRGPRAWFSLSRTFAL